MLLLRRWEKSPIGGGDGDGDDAGDGTGDGDDGNAVGDGNWNAVDADANDAVCCCQLGVLPGPQDSVSCSCCMKVAMMVVPTVPIPPLLLLVRYRLGKSPRHVAEFAPHRLVVRYLHRVAHRTAHRVAQSAAQSVPPPPVLLLLLLVVVDVDFAGNWASWRAVPSSTSGTPSAASQFGVKMLKARSRLEQLTIVGADRGTAAMCMALRGCIHT